MHHIRKIISSFLLLSILFLIANIDLSAQTAEEPVLITSCGQSPGPLKMKIFMKRGDYEFDYDLQASADFLKNKKYSSLIIVTGASLKGMGAAGISIKDELDRVDELIKVAKNQGITIIGAHIEGKARRVHGASSGDNSDEVFIDVVCPKSDILIVRSDGNEDGRFTAIAEEFNIPLKTFEKNLELADILKEIYKK